MQPYEHGRYTSSLQTAAMVAGARRVAVPLDDLHKQALGRCLPNAAAALLRLKAWVGPERRVLVCAVDGQQAAVQTVVAAYLHWHAGWSVDQLQVHILPRSDRPPLRHRTASLCRCGVLTLTLRALLVLAQTFSQEQPDLKRSADLRLIMDTGDLMLAANAGSLPEGTSSPAAGSRRLSACGLKLFRVTFSWKHPAKKVLLVGEAVGGWRVLFSALLDDSQPHYTDQSGLLTPARRLHETQGRGEGDAAHGGRGPLPDAGAAHGHIRCGRVPPATRLRKDAPRSPRC